MRGTLYISAQFMMITSIIFMPWVGWVTIWTNLGRHCSRGARGSEFLSPARTMAALGYLVRREWVVVTRWSINFLFFLDAGGE